MREDAWWIEGRKRVAWLMRLSRRTVTQSMKLVSVNEAIERMEEVAIKEDIQRLRMVRALGDWKMRPE